MTIKVEYRGHEIRYSENSDKWWCPDVNFQHESMSKVKAKIDAMYLKLRKNSAIPCFEISDYAGPSKTESTVIEYVKEVLGGGGYTGKPREVINHRVATYAKRGGNERGGRQERELSRLMPETREAMAAFDEAVRIYREEVQPAQARYKAAFEAIPRLTLDDVAELKRIKDGEVTVGEDG